MRKLLSNSNLRKNNNSHVNCCFSIISISKTSNEAKYRIDNLFKEDKLQEMAIALDSGNEIQGLLL